MVDGLRSAGIGDPVPLLGQTRQSLFVACAPAISVSSFTGDDVVMWLSPNAAP